MKRFADIDAYYSDPTPFRPKARDDLLGGSAAGQVSDVAEVTTIGEARRRSGECDFGVWWREGKTHGPWWRVSFVDDTGEVYAINQAGWYRPEFAVVLLAEGLTLGDVEERLHGWEHVCGEEGSLAWARESLAS